MTQECTAAWPPSQYLTGFKLFTSTVLKTIGGGGDRVPLPPLARPLLESKFKCQRTSIVVFWKFCKSSMELINVLLARGKSSEMRLFDINRQTSVILETQNESCYTMLIFPKADPV